MASYCFKPFKVPRARATLLDSCGVPVTGDDSMSVTTSGIITVEQVANLQDMDDFFEKNGDGDFCIEEVDPEILKWYDLTLTFCEVDPELVYLLTKQALLLSDAPTPIAVGNRSSEGQIKLVNFGFEVFTRLANQADCTEGAKFGYALWPWMVQGKMGDVTYQNGTANFVVTARTHRDSPWGRGPYTVWKSDALATLDQPMTLLPGMAVEAADHRLMFVTRMGLPTPSCGATTIPIAMTAPVEVGLQVTLTLPTGTAPAYINWGDGNTTSGAAGPTSVHVYGVAGTYTIQLWPMDFSSAPYSVTVTVA
jgi:hypothetical protein